jgi:hypothetical protein
MAFLQNPTNPTNQWRVEMPKDMQEAANAKRTQLHRLTASTEGEIDAAFATLAQLQGGALLVAPEPRQSLTDGLLAFSPMSDEREIQKPTSPPLTARLEAHFNIGVPSCLPTECGGW